MLSSEIIKRAIRNKVQSRIYSRGLDYFRRGRVGTWSVKEAPADDGLIISGEVEGSEPYEVELEYNIESQEFSGIECAAFPSYGLFMIS